MTTRERACRCGHGETSHLWAGRFKDCREPTCRCIIYTRTSKRLPAIDGAPTTIADRAILAARRHRDRACEAHGRATMLLEALKRSGVDLDASVTRWASETVDERAMALAEAERTVAELERGAGVPITIEDERSEA